MKISFFGYIGFLPLLRYLANDHCLAEIWTFPHVMDRFANVFPTSKISTTEPSPSDLLQSAQSGVELFLVAGYPHRVMAPDSVFGVNVHPTLLPLGRGPSPVPYVLSGRTDAAGVTVHKLAFAFDTGDVLAQAPIAVSVDDDVDTYLSKVTVASIDLFGELFTNFEEKWRNAHPQTVGEYWKPPEPHFSNLSAKMSVGRIIQISRAYLGKCTYQEGESIWRIWKANGWRASFPEGPASLDTRHSSIMLDDGHKLLIRVADGYCTLSYTSVNSVKYNMQT